MKVVYLNYLFDTKESSVGAAVHVRQFVASARQCGVDIEAFHLNKFSGVEEAVSKRWRAALKKRLSRYAGEVNALLSNLRTSRKEWSITSAVKPDVILTRYNLFNVSAVVVARLRRIPLVLEVNSPMAYENRRFNQEKWHLPVLPEWIERLNLRMAAAVVVVSKVLKDHFVRQGIPGAKIFVVPNGVDPQAFSPQTPSRSVREKYGLHGKVVIGFVGSFHYWHGVDNLLDFISDVVEGYDHVRFLLVGTGPLHGELQFAIRERGYSDRVILPGYVPHEKVPEYVSAMDIVLAPYPAMEFFYFSPLKLFEYMACGKPVVASRLGQIAELIEDGVNGMLYAPEDLSEMAAKCRILIEQPELRAEIGRNARKSILAGHTWRANAEKIVEVMKLASNGRLWRT